MGATLYVAAAGAAVAAALLIPDPNGNAVLTTAILGGNNVNVAFSDILPQTMWYGIAVGVVLFLLIFLYGHFA